MMHPGEKAVSKKKRKSVSLSREIYEALHDTCKVRGISMASVVDTLINQHLDGKSNGQPLLARIAEGWYLSRIGPLNAWHYAKNGKLVCGIFGTWFAAQADPKLKPSLTPKDKGRVCLTCLWKTGLKRI
jgi:hypothetical protein